MARTTATVSFQAIELKGSLLPGSLLEQVARLQAPMQKEADYGLAKGERLRERIDAAWVRLKEIWEEYRDLRERAAQSTAGLHASVRLLREVLGWQDLQPCSGWQHGEAQFPITHRAFEGAVPLIVRGIAADQLDKGSSQFGQEGRRRSPHSCLQECLNADDNANWGLLLTGDRLRLLHDNPSLVKPAYLAVDLELLVEGGFHAEFAVLWLLLHASRFRHPQTGSCVLDTWKEQAQEAGERVLGQLRNSVQQALEALGNGLLQHPENEALRNQLASGALSGQELHRQLLRLVYRFLFLFTAEDRDLLFSRALGQEDPRRRIYREGYSVGRLRELAIRRSASEGPYGDLWQTQRLVFLQLRQSSSPLGLPGLGGLFSEPQCVALEQCELANSFLLRAIRAIGWFQAGDTLTRVNYRDLNTEELGSVYEGLLELHPQLERAGGSWQLSYGGGAGSDRKTTGSYYTPDQLVQLLIVSALLPVIADRLSKAPTPEEKEQALLAIRVLDPACGSGHFLLAAARRLARELAIIRAGDEEPSEELRQECLREVVAHCIYGVDKNPMAVELCKVALWIEAVDPGKPLSFLDAHIQCGDSLVGVFDPKVLEQGIPDEAYKQLTGDEKVVCTSLKKDNQAFSKRGQRNLFASAGAALELPSQSQFDTVEETDLLGTAAKERAYQEWLQHPAVQQQLLAANTYTAAFFLPKTAALKHQVPTSEDLDAVLMGGSLSEPMAKAVQQAAHEFRFLHWHLAFPDVMKDGGFDCVLGNPPWERIKLQEKEFFAARSKAIATAPNKAAREHLIQELRRHAKQIQEQSEEPSTHPDVIMVREFDLAKREAEGSGEFIRGSGRFALTAVGDLNTYALFAEHFLRLIGRGGRSGVIVPTGIATDNSTKAYFDTISSQAMLVSLYDFENRDAIFPGVHRSYKFALLTLGHDVEATDFVFFATATQQLADERRHFILSADDIALINPNTRTCPVFRSQMDSDLTKQIYSRVTVLIDEEMGEASNPWEARFYTRLFHMAEDSHHFKSEQGSHLKRLYEAKMIHLYDHRWATYSEDGSSTEMSLSEKQDPCHLATSRYWVEEEEVRSRLNSLSWSRSWLIGWRDICRSTDERTNIVGIIPCAGVGDTFLLLLPGDAHSSRFACLLADMSSLCRDFVVRQKIGGTHLKLHTQKQIPTLPPSAYTQAAIDFIQPRVLELTYTAHDLKPWAEDLGYDGPPFIFDPERRSLLRAELDAFYAHLYGLNRDELRYILDPADMMGPEYPSETFRVLKNNEMRQFGEYRTQRLILEAWDRMFRG
jgi:hypothetical protein